MGKIKDSSAIGVGVIVFAIFFAIMLGEYYLVNNLTTVTIILSLFLGLFAGWLAGAVFIDN